MLAVAWLAFEDVDNPGGEWRTPQGPRKRLCARSRHPAQAPDEIGQDSDCEDRQGAEQGLRNCLCGGAGGKAHAHLAGGVGGGQCSRCGNLRYS